MKLMFANWVGFAHYAPHLTHKVLPYFRDVLAYMGSAKNIVIRPQTLTWSTKADYVLIEKGKSGIPFFPIEVKASFSSPNPVEEHVLQLLKQVLAQKMY